MEKRQKISIVIGLVAVVVVGAVIWFRHGVPFAQPNPFPVGLPIEKGAMITQSSGMFYGTNQRQITETYVTSVPIDANLTAYESYLANKGWQIIAGVDKSDYKFIAAQADPDAKGMVRITLNYQNSTNHTVSVMYVYPRVGASLTAPATSTTSTTPTAPNLPAGQ